jgi:hypothetical protein
VVRVVAVLLVLSGCDIVLQISPVEVIPPVCGPFGVPTPVLFAQRLLDGQVHDFSVDGTGTIGAAYVKLGGISKLTMLAKTGDVWDVDPIAGRNVGLEDRQGHVNLNGELDVAIVTMPGAGVYHYIFGGTQWQQDTSPGNSVLDVDSMYELLPGNEIDVFDPAINEVNYKRAVITKHPASGVGKNVLMIVFREAPFNSAHLWTEDRARMQPLNNVATVSPSQGVLTEDMTKLVYAAKTEASATSDLFVAEQSTDRTFDAGQYLDSLNTPDHDEDEPWIDATCSTIWFRRDGVTLMANKR